jgi:hypothetical protein
MLLTVLLGSYGVPALAQELFVYPSRGQSPQQMESDKFAFVVYGISTPSQ